MPTLNWTGRRSPSHAGLLDLHYTDHAEVMHCGKLVGWVFALPNGFYLPKVDGLQDAQQATPDSAARKVVEMHEKYRS